MSYKVLLPDGRNLDLLTPEGARAYVAWSPQFVAKGVGQLEDGASDGQAAYILIGFGCVADTLTPEELESQVDVSQKVALASYARRALTAIAADRQWRRGLGRDGRFQEVWAPQHE